MLLVKITKITQEGKQHLPRYVKMQEKLQELHLVQNPK